MNGNGKVGTEISYLPILKAFFFAKLKDTAGGEIDGGGVGREGGGTLVSTLAGRGTTPATTPPAPLIMV